MRLSSRPVRGKTHSSHFPAVDVGRPGPWCGAGMAASAAADQRGVGVNVLSVDLGTSNTVAVLAAYGRPPRVVDVDGASMMPSAVFAAEDGQLVVGRDAERRARLDPSRFEPNP